MYFSKIALVAGATGALAQATQDAPKITNNPKGVSAVATLPEQPFWTEGSLDGNVQGSIRASSGAGGNGVDYEVEFKNLPKEGGPFTYHIHVAPVPEDGNCTDTLAHLDPYARGEDPSCDQTKPETCQVGDMSGKFGKITQDPYTVMYHDPYSSLIEGEGSFFGNRSFVFHFANKTRISCANFALEHDEQPGHGDYPTNNGTYPTPSLPGPSGYPTSTGGMYPTPTASESVPVGAAAALEVAQSFAVVPLLAWMLM